VAKIVGLRQELARHDGVCRFKNGAIVERLKGGDYKVVGVHRSVIVTGSIERAYIVAMGLSGRQTKAKIKATGDGSKFGDEAPF
jgi:hypothetical protein